MAIPPVTQEETPATSWSAALGWPRKSSVANSHTIIPGKGLLWLGGLSPQCLFPSSLLFITMARPPSPGQLAYHYFLKQQEVAIVYLELVFFRLVLSVATLQEAERKHSCLSKCQLPLDPGCSGKWNFPVHRSLGLLILDVAANWPAILRSAEVICRV